MIETIEYMTLDDPPTMVVFGTGSMKLLVLVLAWADGVTSSNLWRSDSDRSWNAGRTHSSLFLERSRCRRRCCRQKLAQQTIDLHFTGTGDSFATAATQSNIPPLCNNHDDHLGCTPRTKTPTTSRTENPSSSSTWTTPFLLLSLRGGAAGFDTPSSTIRKTTKAGKQFSQREAEVVETRNNAILQYWYKRVPKPVRFFISGRIGDVCFYLFERRLSFLLTELIQAWPSKTTTTATSSMSLLSFKLLHFVEHSKDSISFLAGFWLHILPQHALHALLVYGLDSIDTRQKYWTTLMGMYQALSTSAVASTLLNTLLLKTLAMPKTTVFVMTMLICSVVNYFWIGWIVQRSKQQNK